MGLVEGKVALITGAARGQGRSHAVRLAAEGADVIVVDVCAQVIDSVPYALGTESELDETVAQVESLGRRAVKVVADVRSLPAMEQAVAAGLEELGKIDIVCANAGIYAFVRVLDMTAQQWQEQMDVNLTGVFNTVRAAAPSMVERGEGGSIVLTSSGLGLRAAPNLAHYAATKHGVIGLMKVLTLELGEHQIRVNAICPGAVRTPMVVNEKTFELFLPHIENATADDLGRMMEGMNALGGVGMIESDEISDAVVFLCSDAAKRITGVALPVDAGTTVKT